MNCTCTHWSKRLGAITKVVLDERVLATFCCFVDITILVCISVLLSLLLSRCCDISSFMCLICFRNVVKWLGVCFGSVVVSLGEGANVVFMTGRSRRLSGARRLGRVSIDEMFRLKQETQGGFCGVM